jgi:hypothetical protein
MKTQQMSLFQFYSYIDESLHVSGPQAHPQENSHSCSHNHWFSGCTVRAAGGPTAFISADEKTLSNWLQRQLLIDV